MVRSAALSVKENPYVEAATSVGASWRRVIVQHILPNAMAPYMIMLTGKLGAPS
jgi:peptide/nickel transport system permease protein